MLIKVKNYEHINRSFSKWDTPKGKYIGSRAQYEKEMAKEGLIPFREAEKLAEEAKKRNRKEYDGISKRAMDVCLAAKDQADKKGRLKPSDRLLDGMKKSGVCFELPKHYRELDSGKGGFA